MGADTGRGSYAPGRARREQILDVAMAKFATLGYAGTSMSQIARDVGLTAPGLSHHFPTKQHLLLAVAERRFDLSAAHAGSRSVDADGLGPLRMMVAQTERFLDQPGLIELFVMVAAEAADPDGAAHELYRERYERVVAALTQAFRAEVDAGRLRDGLDYESIARECIAVSDGFQLQWVLSNGRLDLVTRVREHLERLTATILPSGARTSL